MAKVTLAEPPTIDGVKFLPYPGSDNLPANFKAHYAPRQIFKNLWHIHGNSSTFGRAYALSNLAGYRQKLEMWEKHYKNNPGYAYMQPASGPYWLGGDWFRLGLKNVLDNVSGLAVAVTPSYEVQLRGAMLLREQGFKLAGGECHWNPTYSNEGGNRDRHWLHIWFKFFGDSKKLGKFQNSGYQDSESAGAFDLNCCGANGRVDGAKSEGGRVVLGVYTKGAPKDLEVIHEFEDAVVGILHGKKHQKCPHEFTMTEAIRHQYPATTKFFSDPAKALTDSEDYDFPEAKSA